MYVYICNEVGVYAINLFFLTVSLLLLGGRVGGLEGVDRADAMIFKRSAL